MRVSLGGERLCEDDGHLMARAHILQINFGNVNHFPHDMVLDMDVPGK